MLQAREGADIIAVDICEDIKSNPYPLVILGRPDGHQGARRAGGAVVAVKADVREREELRAALNRDRRAG